MMEISNNKLETIDKEEYLNSITSDLKRITELEAIRKKIVFKEEQKKESILSKLALIRDAKFKKIKEEENSTYQALSKLGNEISMTIIPYVTNLESEKISSSELKIADTMVVNEIKIGAEVIRKNRNNSALFAFFNGDWNTLIAEGEIHNIDATDDELLAKIPSKMSKRSLLDLKLEAMKLESYYDYLQETLITLCIKYGHDWYLKYVGGGYLPSDIGVSANYICRLCNAKMQEVFSNADDINDLPSLEKRWELCNFNVELPKFDMETPDWNTTPTKRTLKK